MLLWIGLQFHSFPWSLNESLSATLIQEPSPYNKSCIARVHTHTHRERERNYYVQDTLQITKRILKPLYKSDKYIKQHAAHTIRQYIGYFGTLKKCFMQGGVPSFSNLASPPSWGVFSWESSSLYYSLLSWRLVLNNRIGAEGEMEEIKKKNKAKERRNSSFSSKVS